MMLKEVTYEVMKCICNDGKRNFASYLDIVNAIQRLLPYCRMTESPKGSQHEEPVGVEKIVGESYVSVCNNVIDIFRKYNLTWNDANQVIVSLKGAIHQMYV